MPEIVLFKGDRPVFRTALYSTTYTIGRLINNDLSIPDDTISRVHARIINDGGRYRLEDLSSIGTFVDGCRVGAATDLKEGSRIQMGGWSLQFSFENSADDQPTKVMGAGESTKIIPDTRDHTSAATRPLKVTWTDRAGKLSHRTLQAASTVGSDAQCDLVFKDDYISGRHLIVEPSGSQWLVRDLGSTNGTLVWGAKICEICVTEGLEVQIGQGRLNFSYRQDNQSRPASFYGMITNSKNMLMVLERVRKIARTDYSVLIHGESGTGKELMAQAIHQLSLAQQGPYIVLNCGTLPADLIESELFGHEKGSFTGAVGRKIGAFEAAHGGTLFLDEIGELLLELQAKLLRMLENKTFRRVGSHREEVANVRVIAATNRDLRGMVEQGRFREDLYFRLMIVPVVIPPLRDRPEDIELLADYFLRNGTGVAKKLSDEALRKLKRHAWAGNIRELKNVLIRALVFSEADTLSADEIDLIPTLNKDGASLNLIESERQKIMQALEITQGNKAHAADLLGIAKSTLFNKLKDYKLSL